MKTKILIHEVAIKKILDLIMKQNLKQGDKLPPERELAVQLNISRTCIREALRTLCSNYIVKIKRGSGVYVDILDETVIGRYMVLDSSKKEIFIMLKNILEMRYLIETHGFQEAAKNITPEQMYRLYSHEAYEYSLLKDSEAIQENTRVANMDLEQLVLTFQPNTLLTSTHSRLSAIWKNCFTRLETVALPVDVRHTDHMNIIIAIEENSPKKIIKATSAHLEATRKAIEKIMEE